MASRILSTIVSLLQSSGGTRPANTRQPGTTPPNTAQPGADAPKTTQPNPTPSARTRRPDRRTQGDGRRSTAAEPVFTQTLSKPSRNGRMTGCEPRTLHSYRPPVSINAKGVAGLGLFDSGFTGANVYSGQMGEMGFYKVLCRDELIDRFSSYWSVAMPADGRAAVADATFATDIDCVIVRGTDLYLLDLKYYTSGDVTWHSTDGTWLLCRDNSTGGQVGKPRKMSRNMAMAAQRFPTIFPGHRVHSYVVLMPTNAGIGDIHPGTVWPGGVELVSITEITTMLGTPGSAFADAATDAALCGLLKE
jgi:hypothetical protein